MKIIITAILCAALLTAFGLFTLKPHTEGGARAAHFETIKTKCLDGSSAKPDVTYCNGFAEMHMPIPNFMQEIYANATFGLIPHSYVTPSQAQIWRLKTDIERHASLFETERSARFTGEHEEEYRARAKKEACSPDDPLMKQFEGEGLAMMRKGLQCDEE